MVKIRGGRVSGKYGFYAVNALFGRAAGTLNRVGER
jgi:hypothetical protein